jgi:hypothetical protein
MGQHILQTPLAFVEPPHLAHISPASMYNRLPATIACRRSQHGGMRCRHCFQPCLQLCQNHQLKSAGRRLVSEATILAGTTSNVARTALIKGVILNKSRTSRKVHLVKMADQSEGCHDSRLLRIFRHKVMRLQCILCILCLIRAYN